MNREGVDEILSIPVEQEEYENDVYAQALDALLDQRSFDTILVGFTVDAMGYAPAVAARRGLGFASDVFALAEENGSVVATRAFYGAKVHAEVEFPGKAQVILMLRATSWAPAEGTADPTVTEVAAPKVRSRARHLEFVDVEQGDVDITTADFLLSIGRGIGEKENIAQFEELAEKMGAVLSVSRPIVDSGWVPNVRQVGQSGKFAATNGWTISCTSVPPPVAMFMTRALCCAE